MRPHDASAISGGDATGHRHRQHSAAFLCGLTAFLVFYAQRRGHPGFPLDDSWIHQTVARNLATYHVYGFLPGMHSSGSSSMLWTGVLALQYLLLPAVQPWVYSAALNAVFIGLICLLLKLLTEQDGLDPADSWIVALAPLLSGNFLWLGLLGMEHVLFVLLSLAILFWWFRPGRQATVASAWSGALLQAVLTATRPEGLVLVAVLALYARGRWRRWLLLLLGAGCGMAATCAVNWQATRTLLPLTMQGRKLFLSSGQPLTFARRMALEAESLQRLQHVWSSQVSLAGGVLTTGLARAQAFVLLLCAAAVAAVLLARRGRVRLSALLASMIALNAVYAWAFPSEGHGGRHLPLQVLLFLPLLFWGARRCLLRLAAAARLPLARPLATAAVVAAMALSAVASWRIWVPLSCLGIEQINGEHGAMAAWLLANPPLSGPSPADPPPRSAPSRRIAAFDIGRIGYALDGSLVDLGGLTDPGFLQAFRSGRTAAYLQSKGVTLLVLPTMAQERKLFARAVLGKDLDAVQLEERKTICFPEGPSWFVFGATGAAFPCQTAFAMRYRPR